MIIIKKILLVCLLLIMIIAIIIGVFFANRAIREYYSIKQSNKKIEIGDSIPPLIYVSGDDSGDFNCDGRKDQIEINQALNFVASNSEYTTVYLKGPYTYLIDETIIISSNTIFTGDDTAKIKLKDKVLWLTKHKPVITQKNREKLDGWGTEGDSISNVEIYGFEIDGGVQFEPSGATFMPLISFYFPSNISIHDMYLHNSRWDIIRMSSSVGKFPINTKIYNNTIQYSGHEGICFVGVTDFEVYNNSIYSTRTNSGIRAYDSNNFKIYNNTIGNSLARNPSGYAGILIENKHMPIDNAEIYNNLIYGKDGGIHLSGEGGVYPLDYNKNVHINHNRIFKSNIRTTSGTKFTMDGGIKVNGYNNTIIEHNVIEGGITDGIVYEGTSGGDLGYQTIVRNNIIINNEGYGINNKQPSLHTFISNNNIVYNNSLGNYNNTISKDDIISDPMFVSSHNTLNKWYHIVASYDSETETFKIFVNGKEDVSKKVSGFGNIGINSDYLLLGTDKTSTYLFDGKQDELAIWDRSLNSNEIKLLYNNGLPKNIKEKLTDNLQFYLNMENNWEDSSNNHYKMNNSTADFSSAAINGNYAGLFKGNEGVQYSEKPFAENAITISIWIYRNSITKNEQTIISKGSQSHNDHIWLYFKNESIMFELGNGTERYALEGNIIYPWEIDYHVKSQNGHFDGNKWIIDDVTSPCVNSGAVESDYSNEPLPNGERVNIGVYGNTVEASK